MKNKIDLNVDNQDPILNGVTKDFKFESPSKSVSIEILGMHKVATESPLIFTDSPNKITLSVIDTWAKIISNAILYNYAAKIDMEENNNFSIDTLPNI